MTYSNISIVFLTSIIIYLIYKKKMIINPLFIFNLIWLVIISLESLHLFNLLESSNKSHMIILLGLFSFNFGYLFYVLLHNTSSKKLIKKCEYIPRYNILYILSFIVLLYYLIFAFNSLNLLIDGYTLLDVRIQAQNTDSLSFFDSKIINAITILIIIPSGLIIQVIGASEFWYKKKKTMFFIGLVIAILSSIGFGGRTDILNFFLYLVIGYFFTNNLRKLRKIKKSKLLIVSLVSITILTLFTFSRVGDNVIKNLYYYFSMEPIMLDIWVNKVDSLNLYGFGNASLNGFTFSFLYIFKNLFNTQFPSNFSNIYEIIRLTDSEWQFITLNSTRANAYVSIFWFFYLDGRMLGVFLGMMFYGSFIAVSYFKAKTSTNLKTIAVYSFLYQGLFYSFIRFPFSNLYYAIGYLGLVLLVFKKTNRRLV